MNSEVFTPHGFCLAWDPGLVWLQAVSDLLIALAYYSIPIVLVVMTRRRKDLVFRPVLYLFAAFIMACGTTHLLGMISLWIPLYWTEGAVMAVTASLSVTTAILLWPLLPRILAIPSTTQLRTLNNQLADQIRERDEAANRLRTTEESLRQSQKMSAVGQLTGGIAHDFNNMLQAIGSGVELMQRRIDSGRTEEAKALVDSTQKTIERASALVQRLLAFSRRQALAPTRIDLAGLIKTIKPLIQHAIGPAITVELNLQEPCWRVTCDSNQLENALINLAINARDAMLPDGGTLRITTREVVLTANDLAGTESAVPGDFVVISVGDTGTGMTQDVVEHAFEPFFTTKPSGQGTGLGLSQVFGFVSQSDGMVRLDSSHGNGTVVRLYLPRHRGRPARIHHPGAPHSTAIHRACTVLLVDDEDEVRQIAASTLADEGCTVVQAATGAAALAALRQHLQQEHATIDILVADVGLPGGLNGRQLADATREILPGLPVLLITGFAGDAIESAGGLGEKMALLRKPFKLDALVTQVAELARQHE